MNLTGSEINTEIKATALDQVVNNVGSVKQYDPSEVGAEAQDRCYRRMDLLVTRIEEHQKAKGLSDAQFGQRYAKHLGSAKTWRDRLIARKFEEFGAKAHHWKRKLENFVAELDGRSAVALYVPTMPLARGLTALYHRLQTQQTDRRCGVCLAITGCGKSITARQIVNEYPREAVYVRANENWRDSKTQIGRGLAEALGLSHSHEKLSASNSLNRVIEHLKLNPLTIFVDESHEGGVMLMKLIKTLIDETSAKFILLAYPTSWNKMLAATDDSRAEAQQLFGRTLKPVFSDYSSGIKREDVITYLHQAAGLNGEAEEVASQILAMVRTNGNLRLLADAVEAAQVQTDATGEGLTGTLIVEHVKALCPMRKEVSL